MWLEIQSTWDHVIIMCVACLASQGKDYTRIPTENQKVYKTRLNIFCSFNLNKAYKIAPHLVIIVYRLAQMKKFYYGPTSRP